MSVAVQAVLKPADSAAHHLPAEILALMWRKWEWEAVWGLVCEIWEVGWEQELVWVLSEEQIAG